MYILICNIASKCSIVNVSPCGNQYSRSIVMANGKERIKVQFQFNFNLQLFLFNVLFKKCG